MVIENQLPSFAEWLVPALFFWLGVIGAVGFFALIISYLVVAVQRGPAAAAERVYATASQGFFDAVMMSPRRVFALAWLAFKESIRLRVMASFAVFATVLLFAVWFLDRNSPDPGKLYLSFVLSWSGFLVLLMALFLSVFSLPTDIAKRTIYTIVTKPVRQSEIVLGRILGFTAVGTVLLALMGTVSYFFVTRNLTHTHRVDEASLREVSAVEGTENPVVLEGRTEEVDGHRHQASIFQDGSGQTDVAQGHWHQIRSVQVAGKTIYELGPPMDRLTARVPVYGKLRFLDRTGKPSQGGENVGNEWTYRQYIEGGTPAAGVWRFEGVTEDRFPDGFPLQMTLGVFRTHKGQIDKPVLGSVTLRNPRTGLRSAPQVFSSNEYGIYEHRIDRDLRSSKEQPIDLYRDLIDNGAVEVYLACIESGQYFGVAQPDLYIKADQASFLPNYIKGYLGIWLQMVLVITVGVVFSTFLNGPVSMMAALFTLMCGLMTKSIGELFKLDADHGRILGGGGFESFLRMVRQDPMITDLDPGIGTSVIQGVDMIVTILLQGILSLMPDLSRFQTADWVAYGFDIPFNDLLIQFFTAAAYFLPWFVAGYFFLKLREVAK